MTREEKAIIINELTGKLSDCQNFYFTDASGLTVEQINKFRRLCYNKGIEYKVYKNTLITKALEKQEADYSSLFNEVLAGFSGILFSAKAANLPARAIKEFRKEVQVNDKPILKAACIDTEIYVGDSHLNSLSNLKSKNELIRDIIMLLQSPAKNVISALQSGKGKLASIVKTLSEREQIL